MQMETSFDKFTLPFFYTFRNMWRYPLYSQSLALFWEGSVGLYLYFGIIHKLCSVFFAQISVFKGRSKTICKRYRTDWSTKVNIKELSEMSVEFKRNFSFILSIKNVKFITGRSNVFTQKTYENLIRNIKTEMKERIQKQGVKLVNWKSRVSINLKQRREYFVASWRQQKTLPLSYSGTYPV
jgi:hypothetical protein